MGGENVEQVWYGLWLIKAVITLFVASAVVLLCKRFLRCIRCTRAKRRSAKPLIVHSLGTVQLSRKAPDLDSSNIKRGIG